MTLKGQSASAAGHPGRDQRVRHVVAVAVEVDLLLIDGNEDLQRTLGESAERILAVLGFLGLGLVAYLREAGAASARTEETERADAAGQRKTGKTQTSNCTSVLTISPRPMEKIRYSKILQT